MSGPRYLIADDWTHLDFTNHEYDLRWVIDREANGGYGALVAAEYALADGQGWRLIDSQAHWEDVDDHLGDNQLPDSYEEWGDELRFSDELPAWAAAQVARVAP